MENSDYALVLTGEVLPGYAPETVWPALAAYFRTDIDKFRQQVLARAPLEIKQSDDLGKLQTLQAGAAEVGAETDICAPDGRPGLFVLLDAAPRGPVPRVFVEERVEHGLWPAGLTVAEVGSKTWLPFRTAAAPQPVRDLPDASTGLADDAVTDTAPLALVEEPADAIAATPVILPPGAAIHAGFWRRCAAYLLDSIVLAVVSWIVFAISAMSFRSSGAITALTVGVFANTLVMLVIAWLYFALQECSAAQATLGKRALGIKVTDDEGSRISFSRASGRFFAKGISGIIFDIGFLMAGWTARKQALHDMMAGTLVVFRAVAPGQRLPDIRPAMPWYGWLVNILFIVCIALGVIGTVMFGSEIAHLAASGDLPIGGGF